MPRSAMTWWVWVDWNAHPPAPGADQVGQLLELLGVGMVQAVVILQASDSLEGVHDRMGDGLPGQNLPLHSTPQSGFAPRARRTRARADPSRTPMVDSFGPTLTSAWGRAEGPASG